MTKHQYIETIKMAIHTTVEHRWPDLRVEWKKKQLIEVFDMACPLDCNVIEKEKEMIRDYSQLCYDLQRQNPTQSCLSPISDRSNR